MAKKGPISKIEGFYIEQNYRDMDIAELATDLDRSITSIENHIKKNYTKQKTVTGTTFRDEESTFTISDAKRQVVRPNTECVTKIKKD